jgi:hypothetical protein
MDFNDPSEQQIGLSFNQNELADFALPITPAEKMRSAWRSCIIQIEAHRLSGHG